MVSREHQDGVSVITISNPPVNALSTEVCEGIEEAVEAAETDIAVRALVLMGSGGTFVAGADIRQLEELAWERGPGAPNIHELLRKIEDCAKPVVMAIHGSALGGGLELAMAGHFRLALKDARFGQPEVNLGIIPGAEGTQRLPRLAGIEKALEMCVSGKLITASEALEAGIIDAVVEGDLRSQAVEYARQKLRFHKSPDKTREKTARLRSANSLYDAVRTAEEFARKVKRNQIAPLKAVEAIRAAATLPFKQGCERERQLFQECATSDQCRALIHGFFAERAVSKLPNLEKETAISPIGEVRVVGAGTMGRGIAIACANAGMHVVLQDCDQPALNSALSMIHKSYESSIKRGRLSQDSATEKIKRITPQVGHSGAGKADLVVEAVFEDMELKRSIFRELGEAVHPNCILASNTSTLSIDELAAVTKQPERVVGLHFFSPANVMRLLEIVRGRFTSTSTLATAISFAKSLSKVGVIVGNGPGFVGNRLMFPYMYEAQFLVEEGSTPQKVDQALREFGMAMGIFEVDDMAGLDVAWRVRRELHQFSGPGERKPLVADALCERGFFGQKAGRGWYSYGADGKPIADPDCLQLIRSLSLQSAIPQRKFTDSQIIERCLYGLINQGAMVLEEGLAMRASDIDVIYVNGYGFPAWRGGPMFYADTVGLPQIVERINSFEAELGSRWKVSPLLRQLAEAGETFRTFDQGRAGNRSAGTGSKEPSLVQETKS